LNSKDKLCHLLQDTANHNEREGWRQVQRRWGKY
jgi:hypothetical protein